MHRTLAWIPACAGMTEAEGASLTTNVMPAKAGIHASFDMITNGRRTRRASPLPACAGMTEAEGASLTTNVMPAKAGIHASFDMITNGRRTRRASTSSRRRGEETRVAATFQPAGARRD